MTNYRADNYQTGFSKISNVDIAGLTRKTYSVAEAAEIEALITSCEGYIARQCRRQFLALTAGDSYFETFDAGQEIYDISSYPIDYVQTIKLDGAVVYEKGGTSNALTLGTDFFVYDDKIEFEIAPQSMTNNKRALEIYYNIVSEVGDDLKLAIKQWVADLIGNGEFAGKPLASFNIGGASMSFDVNSIPAYVKTVINSYKSFLI